MVDCGEVGYYIIKLVVSYERYVDFVCCIGNDFVGLFFGCNEYDFFIRFCYLVGGIISVFQVIQGVVQVNNVNFFVFYEDIRCYFGVLFFFEVAKVYICI